MEINATHIGDQCPLCTEVKGTCTQLFFECPIDKDNWFGYSGGMSSYRLNITNNKDIIKAITNLLTSISKQYTNLGSMGTDMSTVRVGIQYSNMVVFEKE